MVSLLCVTAANVEIFRQIEALELMLCPVRCMLHCALWCIAGKKQWTYMISGIYTMLNCYEQFCAKDKEMIRTFFKVQKLFCLWFERGQIRLYDIVAVMFDAPPSTNRWQMKGKHNIKKVLSRCQATTSHKNSLSAPWHLLYKSLELISSERLSFIWCYAVG